MHALLIPLEHAFGERYELPLPLWLFVVGGAAVVLVSFLVVLRRPTAALPQDAPPDVVPPSRFHPFAGPLSVLVALLVAYTGIAGVQETSENIAPLFFWLGLWIVVPMTVGILGDWSRPVNPFANLARLGDTAAVRRRVLARGAPLQWSFGWWPAVGLFVALVLGELVFNLDATTPSFVGWTIVLYGLACAFLGLLYGESFVQRGEVFSGLFDAWGRLGFWRHGAPGARRFGGGLDVPFDTSPSRVVFVLLMLVSINFDGLLATPRWSSYERRTVGTDPHDLEVLRVGSLLLLALVVLGVFLGFAYLSARAGRFGTGPLGSLALLLPSLVPIAYGYLVAHYLQYVVINGQLLLPLIGNPGYPDWPVHLPRPFNDDYVVNVATPGSSFYWYLSVVVIVAVHVIAVLLANRRLAARAADPGRARRAEYPWLVAMVAYTAFSLVLIAQPLTEESNSGTTVTHGR
ncbi:MAG TPA: hypothetical protein VM097_10540 [Mycobacteriales bacterium]|nr:hypothetical protein [Mycobacteriales bacterium]